MFLLFAPPYPFFPLFFFFLLSYFSSILIIILWRKYLPLVEGDPIDGECGVVTILDTVNLKVGDEDNGYDLNNAQMDGVIAHFVAHNKAIVGLQFDPSGSLLLTADKPGNSFNIFRNRN